MQRKVLFIINPNSGKKISDKIISTIKAEFSKSIHYQIVIWEDKNRFQDITYLLKTHGYTDAVAVGGDGTVNEVAKNILGTDIALGIIPVGSGNGLARSLGLSMKLPEAIKQVERGYTTLIDNGIVNGRPFFCTSGAGFDAHIGNLFASSVKRGFSSYVKITIRELFAYRAKNYSILVNNEIKKRKAFLITVANAGQYGNDFYIAPEADLRDGFFHVAILKPFNPFQVLGLLSKIVGKKAHTSSLIETFRAKSLSIKRENGDTIHFDGEPAMEGEEIRYECFPRSLKVIVGNKF